MCKPRCPPVMCTKAMPAPPCKLVKSVEKDRNGCPKHPGGIKVCPTPKPCPSTADICAGKATCQHNCRCPMCKPRCPPVMCTKAMPAPPCKLVKSAEKDRNGCPKHPCGIKVCPTPKPCPSTADICAGKATCQHKCPCPMCKPRCPPVMCTKAMPAPPCKLVKSAEKDRNGCPKHPC